ncbi:O-antigen polymerase [Paenibacillus rhizophilus]|uniref:Oligosaccharide repeat unit polymerase n=1 Tax=Paenibacillus rhizophilus TaxID=1850366 RepID=A0A3N9P886_9BACL|nr:O-antigen polymerase [Paenibacillus rhizophilus]RQW12428.1 oligosaccharide repeat unit polymerase [Paenibacillus rhizophilus]
MIEITTTLPLFISSIYIILLYILYTKKIKKLSPAISMQFFWIIFISLALVFAGDINIGYLGIIWIIISINFYSFGSIVANGFYTKKSVPEKEVFWTINYAYCKKILIVAVTLFMVSSLYSIISTGIRFSTFLDLNQLFDLNAQNAQDRYLNQFNFSLGERVRLQINTILSYFTPFLSGIFLVVSKNIKDKVLCWISFIPTIIGLLSSNAKLGLIVVVFFFVCGILTTQLLLYKKIPELNIRVIIKIVALIVIFFLLLFIAMILRAGRYDAYMIEILKIKFVNYIFGSVFAFDYWFNSTDTTQLYFGARTFNAVTNILGTFAREQGVYKLFYSEGFYNTNVYTVFRGIIEDFGKIGGLIFMYTSGVIAGYSHRNILSNKPSAVCYAVLSANYFFILYSFIISPWSYTSLIAVFILMALVLKILKENRPLDSIK